MKKVLKIGIVSSIVGAAIAIIVVTNYSLIPMGVNLLGNEKVCEHIR